MTLRSLVFHPLSVALLAIIGLGLAEYIYVIDQSGRALLDLSVYMQAGEALSAGENIYQRVFVATDRLSRPIELYYLYPPFLAHLLSKFADAGAPSIKFAWCQLSFVALCVTIVSIARLLKGSWWKSFSPAARIALVGFLPFVLSPYTPVLVMAR